MSLGMFVSVYLLLRDQLNRQNTLLLLLVLVTDGWIVYTNRISVIENTLLLLILLALLYYQFAYRGNWGKGQRFALYILAGSLMGFAGVFKHTGLYVLLVIPIHWLLIRRHTWEHISALVAACAVIALYLAWMVLSYDQEFLRQLLVQVRRVTGFYTSRGVISVADLVTSALGTYSVFIGSILLATSSIIFILVKFTRAIKQRSLTILRGGTSLYLSWTLAALIFFGLISLKFPQYFMLVLVPMYCYVGAELLQDIQRYQPESYKWFVCFVVLVVGLNAASFVERFMLQDDNAIIEAVTYAWDYIPNGAVIATDEPIGSIISQEYLRIDDWEVWMEILPPAYIITYTTQTQKLPDSQPLRDLIADSIKHHKITGFKETITIYEVPPYSPGSP
jgi:4-amino-4-deoxy-L-arabinose transferase-like glycosyltransferase